jgi:hypothetical protein
MPRWVCGPTVGKHWGHCSAISCGYLSDACDDEVHSRSSCLTKRRHSPCTWRAFAPDTAATRVASVTRPTYCTVRTIQCHVFPRRVLGKDWLFTPEKPEYGGSEIPSPHLLFPHSNSLPPLLFHCLKPRPKRSQLQLWVVCMSKLSDCVIRRHQGVLGSGVKVPRAPNVSTGHQLYVFHAPTALSPIDVGSRSHYVD